MNAREEWPLPAEVPQWWRDRPLTPAEQDAMADEASATVNHEVGEFCTYCGNSRNRLSCCGEVHFMTAQEFFNYHGDWPADYEDAPE